MFGVITNTELLDLWQLCDIDEKQYNMGLLSKEITQLFKMAGEATLFILETLVGNTTTHILLCATLRGQTQHTNGILSKLAWLKIVCCDLLPLTYPLCGSKHYRPIMPCCNVQVRQNCLQMPCTSDYVCHHCR